MGKKAVILANVGTPDSPKKSDVSRYLLEFLGDKRVIDYPWLLRKILVNLIIVPFRVSKSSKLYERLWDDKGSPLLYHSESLRAKLSDKLGENFDVFNTMRYGSPSLEKLLKSAQLSNYEELIFVPMFPQYASSTSGTVVELIYEEMRKKNVIQNIKVIGQFYAHPGFIDCFAENISKFDLKSYDFIMFTYHSLPISHIDSVHPNIEYKSCNCIDEFPNHGTYCYKATCYETTRKLILKLNIDKSKTITSFQSRLTKNWVTPFSDEVIIDYAKKGMKRGLIIAPSFTTDCLETIIELENDYGQLFRENGGEVLDMVPSLNDNDSFAKFLSELVKS
ncbi:MAG: ferrochelatase [Candidatus Kapabacteria bacterium]|nr:ferrochelatase [Ignavibacteriota bacterium]MCW5885498.1 ferrochelatase [Candidatus Kapabacteria bacterium]